MATNDDKSVSVPSIFWERAAVRDYSSPATAIIRELLQNSRDARAKTVAFETTDDATTAGSRFVLRCRDDGVGMTAAIVETKLMALGETTKSASEGSTGGFGVAKILLFFCHPRYEIRTRDLLIVGSGGNYRIEAGQAWTPGTDVRIWLSQAVVGDHLSANDYACMIRRELACSYLPGLSVSLGGVAIDPGPKAGRTVSELEGGIVIHRRLANGGRSSETACRVRGLQMFSIWSGESRYVYTVELSGYSVELLTSNRDGFRGDHRRRVEQAIQALIGNASQGERSSLVFYQGQSSRAATLTDKLHDILAKIEDAARVSVDEYRLPEVGSVDGGAAAFVCMVDEILSSLEDRQVAGVIKAQVSDAVRKATESGEEVQAVVGREISITSLQSALKFNVFVEMRGRKRGIPKKWRPETLSDRHQALLDLWSEVVSLTLSLSTSRRVIFDTGILLDDGSESDGVVEGAKYRRLQIGSDGGRDVFFLNPLCYGEEGRLPLGAARRFELLLWLMDLASHEITHFLGCSHHNEIFITREAGVRQIMNRNMEQFRALIR